MAGPLDWPGIHAASTAFQIAGAVWSLIFKRRSANWFLPMRRSSSMPAIVDGRAIIVLEAEHGPGPEFDPSVVLLDQVVQVFRRSQFGVLPCLIFIRHLTHGAMRGMGVSSAWSLRPARTCF